jgi:hypothetical protein
LDSLSGSQKLTAVGYGGQEPVNQPGGPVIAYLDTREYAVSTLNAINPAWLRLSQNPAHGDGGACYGDSGGPNFLGAGASETNIVAATTITGDALCKSTNVIIQNRHGLCAQLPERLRHASVKRQRQKPDRGEGGRGLNVTDEKEDEGKPC